MSFTAEVKDELSRVEGVCDECELAELSALIRICGTLSLAGAGSSSVRIVTASGAVARTLIKLTHKVFDLETTLTVRRSVLHKTRNYLIEIPEQPRLAQSLQSLGILDTKNALVAGVDTSLVKKTCCRRAYLRGAFMAGGFIANPRKDFHLEISVSSEELANALAALIAKEGVIARINHRRGSWVVYLKSFDDIETLLVSIGAARTATGLENVRVMKSLKSHVNRTVNAELANQARAGSAAVEQLELIERVEQEIGLSELPAALQEFCNMRRAYPELSLTDLGQQFDPPLTKSALYHRVLRLRSLVDE